MGRPSILEAPEIERVARYLRNVFEVEGAAYDILDRIAKAKRKEELLAGLYAALRLQDKVKKEKGKEIAEQRNLSEEEAQKLIHIPSEAEIKGIVELAEGNLRETARYLASLALAYPSKGGG